jgi:broad specificity phosphatase PhoE
MNTIESRIFIARHGETVSNASHTIQGRQNVPLNDKGKKQAEEKANLFSNCSIQYIGASPLDRTVETADIISKQLGIQYQIYDDLIARSYGPWEGKTIQWIKENYQDLLADMWEWNLEKVFLHPPTEQIESYNAVSERVFALFRGVILSHPNENGLFITHGGVITSLLLSLLLENKEIPLLKQDGYVELVYSHDQFRLEKVVGLCEHEPSKDGKRVIIF